jgi:ABC-2 type transport system ATP-binding protein
MSWTVAVSSARRSAIGTSVISSGAQSSNPVTAPRAAIMRTCSRSDDALADTISVIDRGEVIAEGTARELESRIGGEQLEVRLTAAHPSPVAALAPLTAGPVHVSGDGRRLTAPVETRGGMATAVIRALDAAGVSVDDVEVHRPSLDDVFFALTGRPAEPAAESVSESEPTPADAELVEV